MSTAVPEYAARISRMAQRRSKVWGLMLELWEGTDSFILSVRDGDFGEALREHFQDIGQESLAHGSLMSLDVYSRGSRRRTFEADREAFLADRDLLVGDQPYRSDIETMMTLCRAESQAWAAGDLNAGRDARKQEFLHLDGGLEQNLVELLTANIDTAKSHVWRTLSRIFLVFLATETGHQSALNQR
ncbi:hypothetical protein [Flaviflexus equikiangi]|uniref:Uncharacterized protein n=1 Tax=Flaviflexus equikiangi TaxID=2758573 RepID=A0ABS2TFS6_9ACTO|nr:hypothetical protein [Flaviflexus equikiangi]MBM9433504.1 hypothetical protein [Flaviflexus equikiangi]